jgi:hypothetical protein
MSGKVLRPEKASRPVKIPQLSPTKGSTSNKKNGMSDLMKLAEVVTTQPLGDEAQLMARNITDPGETDILLGRGKPSWGHSGNKQFREFIGLYLKDYTNSACRKEKSKVLEIIYDDIVASGGRFLKFDDEGGTWYQVGKYIAREKIAHALRDATGCRINVFPRAGTLDKKEDNGKVEKKEKGVEKRGFKKLSASDSRKKRRWEDRKLSGRNPDHDVSTQEEEEKGGSAVPASTPIENRDHVGIERLHQAVALISSQDEQPINSVASSADSKNEAKQGSLSKLSHSDAGYSCQSGETAHSKQDVMLNSSAKNRSGSDYGNSRRLERRILSGSSDRLAALMHSLGEEAKRFSSVDFNAADYGKSRAYVDLLLSGNSDRDFAASPHAEGEAPKINILPILANPATVIHSNASHNLLNPGYPLHDNRSFQITGAPPALFRDRNARNLLQQGLPYDIGSLGIVNGLPPVLLTNENVNYNLLRQALPFYDGGGLGINGLPRAGTGFPHYNEPNEEGETNQQEVPLYSPRTFRTADSEYILISEATMPSGNSERTMTASACHEEVPRSESEFSAPFNPPAKSNENVRNNASYQALALTANNAPGEPRISNYEMKRWSREEDIRVAKLSHKIFAKMMKESDSKALSLNSLMKAVSTFIKEVDSSSFTYRSSNSLKNRYYNVWISLAMDRPEEMGFLNEVIEYFIDKEGKES